MKKLYLYMLIAAASIVLVAAAIFLVGNVLKTGITEDMQIELYTDAFEVMLDRLDEGNLLPEISDAKLVEESFHVRLNEGLLQSLADRLNEIYPFAVSVSYGHERFEDPQKDSVAFIYLNGITDSKRVRIEAWINNNTYPVIMDYRYRNNEWKLENALYAW